MTYYRFPYYAQSIDGLARVVFSDFNNFEILKADDIKIKQLENIKTRCDDIKDWFPAPCELDKNFYYEVIEGRKIHQELYTDWHIIAYKRELGRNFIKTGRRFTL